MYNSYNPYYYTCPYYRGTPIYNPNTTYSAYNPYAYAYNANAPMYNAHFSNQFPDEYAPYKGKMKNHDSTQFRDYGAEPFVINIEEATKENDNFRTALWTGTHLQLTLMNINVGDDIGLEIHPDVDQFLRIEEGEGVVMMGDSQHNLSFRRRVSDDFVILIPAGKWHNVINTGNRPLKIYSIYAPPEHPHGTVHETKAEAMAAEEHHI